jgi:hypothetical protein
MVERVMPIRFVRSRYGDPVRWRRQLRTIRNLLTVPPDQWGGLVRWDLPAYMAVEYDMNCTGCCSGCCCDIPTTLCMSFAVEGGGPCTACGEPTIFPPGPVTDYPISTTDVVTCPDGLAGWDYNVATAPPYIICAINSVDIECGSNGLTNFIAGDANDCGGFTSLLNVTDCDPFFGEFDRAMSTANIECFCNGDGSETDNWHVEVYECPP